MIDKSLKELQAAFNFTDDDLAANRAGLLSEHQRRRSARQAAQASLASRMASALVITLVLVFSLLAWPRLDIPLLMLATLLVFFLVIWITALFPRLLTRLLRLSSGSGADQRESEGDDVEILSGRIQLQTGSGVGCILRLDEQKFNLSPDQLLALRNNHFYNLYCGRRRDLWIGVNRRVILSVEPVDPAEPAEADDQAAALIPTDSLRVQLAQMANYGVKASRFPSHWQNPVHRLRSL